MPYNSDDIGHQGGHTSFGAANDMKLKAGTVRASVLRALRKSPDFPMTSEDLADVLGLPYSTVQPRTSELRRADKIEPSGITKTGKSGKRIIAWRIKQAKGPQNTGGL